MNLKETGYEGVDLIHQTQDWVMSSFGEHSNEASGFINDRELLTNYLLQRTVLVSLLLRYRIPFGNVSLFVHFPLQYTMLDNLISSLFKPHYQM
jgi:hypothetical protein